MRFSRRSWVWLAVGCALCGVLVSLLASRTWRKNHAPSRSFVTETDHRRALSEARSPDLGSRRTALLVLAFSGDAESREPLELSLKESNVELRRIGVLGLGILADPKSAQVLGRALDDTDPAVAVDAAWGLGRLPAGRGYETLNRAFSRSGPAGRVVAEALVFGLARVGSSKAPSAILRGQLEQDAAWATEPGFSLVMGWALQRLQSPRAVELLSPAARDGGSRATQLALSLEECRGLEAVVNWLAVAPQPDLRQEIAGHVEHMQQTCAAGSLAHLLASAVRPEQRRAAAELLYVFGDQASVRALLVQASDADAGVRNAVRETLSRLGAPLPTPSGYPPPTDELAFFDPFLASTGQVFAKALAGSTSEDIGQVADVIARAHGISSVAGKDSYRLRRELLESLSFLGMPKVTDPFGWLDESHVRALARGLLAEDRGLVNRVKSLWLLFDKTADPLLDVLASSDNEKLRGAVEQPKATAAFPPGTAVAVNPFLKTPEEQPAEAALLQLAEKLLGSTNRPSHPSTDGPADDGGREYFVRRSMEFDALRGHVSPRVAELLLAGMDRVTEDYANGIVELLATAPLPWVAAHWVRVLTGPNGVSRQAFLRNTCIRELTRLRHLTPGAEREGLIAWIADALGSEDVLRRKASVCLAHAMPDGRLTQPLSNLLTTKLEPDEYYLAVTSLASSRDERAISALEVALDAPGNIAIEATSPFKVTSSEISATRLGDASLRHAVGQRSGSAWAPASLGHAAADDTC